VADEARVLVADELAFVDCFRSSVGLAGMRERVALYGGSVESGPAEAGGWRLEASLPLTD
jgi:signal transduction histidine kinase